MEETKMKRSKIRAISLLMAAIMAFSMLGVAPLMVFADEAEKVAVEAVEVAGEEAESEGDELVDPLAGDVAQIVGGAAYTTLDEALSWAVSGDTINLLADINEDTLIYVLPGETLTINTSGFDMNLGTQQVIVNTGATLNIIGGGTLSVVAGGAGSKAAGIVVDGGKATINADIVSGNHGVSAYRGAVVIINGSINNAAGDGVIAFDVADVFVAGNITSGGGAGFAGAYALGVGAQIVIGGNIVATHPEGVGAWVDEGGEIIVNGSITAAIYIITGDGPTSQLFGSGDYQPTSSLDGYLEFTDGVSFVWVLIPVPGAGTGGDGIAATGDTAFYGLALLFSLLALGALGLAMSRKLRVKESL